MWTLKEEFSHIEIGRASHFRNLALFPLVRRSLSIKELDYLLLEDGIAQGKVRIAELHGGGSVPELCLTNTAELPILLLDGEELVGAKQNRVLNLTLLVPAKQKTVIPVSCVEAGRWTMANPELRPSDHLMYARLRADRASQITQSLRSTGSRFSDQSAVWEEIADKSAQLGVNSPTGAMSAIYERHANSVEEYIRAFAWKEGQIGAAFAIGEHVIGLDVFDHLDVMKRFFGKLVRSYTLDALDVAVKPAAEATVDSVAKFVTSIGDAPSFSEPALGLGKDVRFDAPQISGAALWARERYVHICAFAKSASNDRASFRTHLTRPSRRRMF